MVSKKNIQEQITIPVDLSTEFKEELGRRMLEEVRDRTNRSIDKNGKSFAKYSKDYKDSLDFKIAGKSSKVDLQQTGDMLAELDVIVIGGSSITIGYPLGHEDAGKIEGNTIGSFGKPSGNASKARDFIGLPQKVVNRLVAEMRQEPEFQEVRSERDSLISNILGRF